MKSKLGYWICILLGAICVSPVVKITNVVGFIGYVLGVMFFIIAGTYLKKNEL